MWREIGGAKGRERKVDGVMTGATRTKTEQSAADEEMKKREGKRDGEEGKDRESRSGHQERGRSEMTEEKGDRITTTEVARQRGSQKRRQGTRYPTSQEF